MMMGSLFNRLREETDLSSDKEQKEKQRGFERLANNYSLYRPEVEQARVNSFNESASRFKPVSDLLTQMYGPQAALDMTMTSPMPEGANQIGMPTANYDDAEKTADVLINLGGFTREQLEGGADPELAARLKAGELAKANASNNSKSTPSSRSSGPTYNPGKV